MHTSDGNQPRTLRRYMTGRNFLICILLVLCLVELRAFVLDLHRTFETAESYVSYQHGKIFYTPDAIAIQDIAPWMTFGYINFIFKLPPNYLEAKLHLSTGRYPNMQLTRYARMNNLNIVQLVQNVRQAVSEYKP